MGDLIYLAYISILLVIGIVASVISKKLKVSKFALLLIFGMILGKLSYQGMPLISFGGSAFLISLSILTLVMVVFDGSSRFNIKEIDNLYVYAIRLVMTFVLLSVVIVAPLAYYLCGFDNILYAIFFAVIISGTDPTAMFSLFGQKSNRVSSMLELESILNTPIIVILSFLILDMVNFNLGFESI